MTAVASRTSTLAFSSERFDAAVSHYRGAWSLADAVLRRLCAAHPRHDNLGAVNAKLLIIGRAYATGIERKVRSAGGQGSSLSQIAQCMLAHGAETDEIIASLPADTERLDEPLLEPVLIAHGRLVQILAGITLDAQSARSFVSKYLHFHRPVVPLIDRFAEGIMPRLVRWRPSLSVVPCRRQFDEPYHTYVMRLWNVLGQARLAGCDPTVKELDYYVLWEAEHAWTR